MHGTLTKPRHNATAHAEHNIRKGGRPSSSAMRQLRGIAGQADDSLIEEGGGGRGGDAEAAATPNAAAAPAKAGSGGSRPRSETDDALARSSVQSDGVGSALLELIDTREVRRLWQGGRQPVRTARLFLFFLE